jgi:Tfp pilus assembly PilM family ATPase
MNLFTAGETEEPVLDEEKKEGIAELLMNADSGEFESASEETLDALITRLTTENIEFIVHDVICSMREMDASKADIEEALSANLSMHLSEAKEVYKDYLKEERKKR